MKILITGVAGFIGYHLSSSLLDNGVEIFGIDNINDYYDVKIKLDRLKLLQEHKNSDKYTFTKLSIENNDDVKKIFEENEFDIVIHLAAQAGVRYSIENPQAYVDSNLIGFVNILEGCRHSNIKHFLFASSSSVYGMNSKQPFSTDDKIDKPISLYAATKKSNELIAYSYSHLYEIPTTGLRFFTVYGPMGRPDMAYFKFTKSIINGVPIDVYNNGDMERDFTFINDIVEAILLIINKIPNKNKQEDTLSQAPYKIYNIGNNKPVSLRRFIKSIEKATGIKAVENNLPMQSGDVKTTYADIDDLTLDTGFKPKTSIESGIKKFVVWYKEYYAKK